MGQNESIPGVVQEAPDLSQWGVQESRAIEAADAPMITEGKDRERITRKALMKKNRDKEESIEKDEPIEEEDARASSNEARIVTTHGKYEWTDSIHTEKKREGDGVGPILIDAIKIPPEKIHTGRKSQKFSKKASKKDNDEMEKKQNIKKYKVIREKPKDTQRLKDHKLTQGDLAVVEMMHDAIAPTVASAEKEFYSDGSTVPIVEEKEIEMVENATNSASMTSLKSEGSSKKGGRHGSWEYVPAAAPVYYPKISKKEGDRKSRELAKLAMSIVDSQHDLTKKPEEWYTGSDFDLSRPLTMADRIKRNRRINAYLEQTKKEMSKAKAKKPEMTNPSKGRKRSKKEKGGAKSADSLETVDSVHTAIEGDEGSQYEMISLSIRKCVDDVTTESIPADVSMPHESDHNSSHVSEELGTPYHLLMEDVQKSQEMFLSPLSEVEQPRPLLTSPLLSFAYSPIDSSNSFPTEMPEDFLEENDDGIGEDNKSGSESPLPKKILPSDDDLADMDYDYTEDGVYYRPRIVLISNITQDTYMMELMRYMNRADVWIIPVRRSNQYEGGRIAVVYRTIEMAEDMLKKGRFVVEGSILEAIRPGAFLVHVDHNSIMEGQTVLAHIELTIGSILYMQEHSCGYIVILPCIKQASELLHKGFEGTLTFSSLRDYDDEKVRWPKIDLKWAEELGIN